MQPHSAKHVRTGGWLGSVFRMAAFFVVVMCDMAEQSRTRMHFQCSLTSAASLSRLLDFSKEWWVGYTVFALPCNLLLQHARNIFAKSFLSAGRNSPSLIEFFKCSTLRCRLQFLRMMNYMWHFFVLSCTWYELLFSKPGKNN